MSKRHPSRTDSARWARVRRAVFDRDGWRCTSCGRAGRLECHHVRPVEEAGDRWDMANLRTLCRGCHVGLHARERLANLPPAVREWRRLIADKMRA